MKIVAVIPAREGSKRLKHKNITKILGKPLIGWVIDSASKVIGIENVYVSTESDKIAKISKNLGSKVIDRPSSLSGDNVWTEMVIQHAVSEIEREIGRIDLVLWMNASIPEITADVIETAIKKLNDLNLREVFTVDKMGVGTSAVRVLRRETLYQGCLSVHCGVIQTDYLDIHYKKDLDKVSKKMKGQ